MKHAHLSGFTIIELSILLVIIGLLIGGVMVGRDLIASARIRSQISQIERFSTAVRVFKLKFNNLPGDIAEPTASLYGFPPRGLYGGEGDGNGILMGIQVDADGNSAGYFEGAGETVMLWSDLAAAHLISGDFSLASPTVLPSGPVTGNALKSYFPPAVIGQGNYIYAWSSDGNAGTPGANYFGLSAVSQLASSILTSSPGLTVSQAYSIDVKMDDGYAQSGTVIAAYLTNPPSTWWAGYTPSNIGFASSTTCYDNLGHSYNLSEYSTSVKSNTGLNCALSFIIQ